MDATCKKAFIIIFGLSSLIFLVFAWIIVGGEKIRGGWFNGIFDDLSIMWLPTILYLIVGGIIDMFLFKGSLFNCREKNLNKK
jgi:hypothetical protein